MKNILNYLLHAPTNSTDPGLELQNKIFVFVTLTVSAITAFFSITYILYGMISLGIAQAVISVCALSAFAYFKNTGDTIKPIHFILIITWLASIFRVYKMGGISAPTFYTYAIIPAYTTAALPVAAAIFWTGLFLLVPVVFYQLQLHGQVFSSAYPTEALESARIYGIFFGNLVVLAVGLAVKKMFSKYKNIIEAQKEEKSELLRLVAHDIATPISTLRFGLEFIQRGLDGGKVDPKVIARCERAIESMAKLVENVNRFESLRSGKVRPHLQIIPVHMIVDYIVDCSVYLFESKRIQFQIEPVSPKLSVITDHNLLVNHIICNLISNAIKFSNAYSTVHLKIQEEEEYIQFSLQDEGVGIPRARLVELTQPKLASSTPGTQGERGSGFGLSIVNAVVGLIGGKFNIESKSAEDGCLKTGTQAHIFIPKA